VNTMMGLKRITIAQYERGLLFRNRSFEAVMEPGVHWMFDPLNRTEIKVYDVAVTEFEYPRVDVLITEARALIERHLMIVELGDREADWSTRMIAWSRCCRRARVSCTGADRS
jgi:hypothetical protein